MTLLENIKPFWPLLFTFVLPKALGYYQALKTAYRTRPPPRPLSVKAGRSLNILFVSICIFLWLSVWTSDPWSHHRNVFADTGARSNVPTDLLFGRLATLRPNGRLTPRDEELRSKLNTVQLRQTYLRYGPNTLINCPFCHPDQPLTYLLHYLPTNILLPHLLHLVTLGLATSRSISGPVASSFRLKFLITSLVLVTLDIYMTSTHDLPATRTQTTNPVPQSLHTITSTIRPILLLTTDVTLAFLIYITSTGRFLFFPFLASASASESSNAAADPQEAFEQTTKLINDTSLTLQMAQMKLRGLNVARNAVVRDQDLKGVDDEYWRVVRRVEAEDGVSVSMGGGGEDVFEHEDVQAALARAFGSGEVDVARLRKEAAGFVDNVTRGLD